jgi:hypothetical protein
VPIGAQAILFSMGTRLTTLVDCLDNIYLGRPNPKPEQNTNENIEDDLRTLCRYEEIKSDPKRLKAVQALAKQKMADMSAINSI